MNREAYYDYLCPQCDSIVLSIPSDQCPYKRRCPACAYHEEEQPVDPGVRNKATTATAGQRSLALDRREPYQRLKDHELVGESTVEATSAYIEGRIRGRLPIYRRRSAP
jgi:hypothetical protein